MFKCENCGIEFEAKREAKYCSPKCKLQAFRRKSIETDNVTFSQIDETDKFRFKTYYAKKPGDEGYDERLAAKHNVTREALYWYDVPLAAIPILEKDWPPMPDYMNGRQYFLWWKNDFKMNGKSPQIHNPFPARDKVEYVAAAEGSRKWGL